MTGNKTNLAAWLDEAGKPFRIAEAPIGIPEQGEILIKVCAVAINPVDHARQSIGFFTPSYPWILGCDGAGVVEKVGTGIDHVEPGDRVMVMADEFFTKRSTHSIFQQHAVIGHGGFCKIPESVSFTDASIMPLGTATAASMLFDSETLHLELPNADPSNRTQRDEVVIVWGGSSSVGISALQLAKAASYRTIGIASSRNFELMRRAGVDASFDHADDGIVDKICDFVMEKEWTLSGVAAVIPTERPLKSCGEIAQRLPGNKFVSTSLARGISPVPNMPKGVNASNCLSLAEEKVREHIWKKFVPAALENGQLKCLPCAEVTGKGVDSIDAACETLRKGVSGKKVVVKLD